MDEVMRYRSIRRKWIVIVPVVIVGIVLVSFLGGQIVKLLWNWLLPPLFGWPSIGFWQALGLLALCRILFGGHGMGRSSRRRGRMADRMDVMTPDERERFRARMRERFGLDPDTPGPAAP
jgi:hypothetical protein